MAYLFSRMIFRLQVSSKFAFGRFLHSTSVGKDHLGSSEASSLTFNNAQEVFGHRSTSELLRAFFVLHACSIETMVERSQNLMKLGKRILAPTILSSFLAPFYSQFVAGDSEKDMIKVAQNLSSIGINLMIAPMLETDIGEENGNMKELFENNFEKTLQLITLSSKCKPAWNQLKPVCQTKITAHISADVLFKISTFYNGLNPDKRKALIYEIGNIMKTLNTNRGSSVSSTTLNCLPLSTQDLDAVKHSLPKLVQIGSLSKERNVILAVDAEYTYTNPAISLFTLALMAAFNDESPIIWNTYQGYLKETKFWLKHDMEIIEALGTTFGAKIVRGAYLEREREYAKINNLPSPVNDSYEMTNKNYDSTIDFITPYVAKSNGKYQIVVATHNEASVTNAVEKMALHNIPNSSANMLFAQIYGMAENISVPLSKGGYSVYKSVPYGNMNEVIPYLSRRANENRAVFRGARRERALLSQELLRRMKITSQKNTSLTA